MQVKSPHVQVLGGQKLSDFNLVGFRVFFIILKHLIHQCGL